MALNNASKSKIRGLKSIGAHGNRYSCGIGEFALSFATIEDPRALSVATRR